MKNYELNYLISPEISEQELKTINSIIVDFIKEKGGILKRAEKEKISKMKLSYPIKKFKQAFFSSLLFSLEPDKLVDLEKKLKAGSKIIRYMIIIKKDKEKAPISDKIMKKSLKKEEVSKIGKPSKVELKEIDQKIEEILKE